MKGTPSRHHSNKNYSAKKFSKQTGRTKEINMRRIPMRGGYRI